MLVVVVVVIVDDDVIAANIVVVDSAATTTTIICGDVCSILLTDDVGVVAGSISISVSIGSSRSCEVVRGLLVEIRTERVVVDVRLRIGSKMSSGWIDDGDDDE